MRRINKNALIYILFTPIASLVIWLLSTHTWTHFINIFFTITIMVAILLFTFLIIQEGILDVTSYGFRKFRYQMMRKKNRSRFEDDAFLIQSMLKSRNTLYHLGLCLRFLFMSFTLSSLLYSHISHNKK